MTHIYVSDLTSVGSDNDLSPGRRQAIIRTNAGILLIIPVGTNFSEFLVEILIFSFKKMRLKESSAKRQPFCLGLNELNRFNNSKRKLTQACVDYMENGITGLDRTKNTQGVNSCLYSIQALYRILSWCWWNSLISVNQVAQIGSRDRSRIHVPDQGGTGVWPGKNSFHKSIKTWIILLYIWLRIKVKNKWIVRYDNCFFI